MRSQVLVLGIFALPTMLLAQPAGRFTPDSLLNTNVIPRNTPVIQVSGIMPNFTGDLGVRCQFCHVGEEGMPLGRFDFAKDEKRTKLVARQMIIRAYCALRERYYGRDAYDFGASSLNIAAFRLGRAQRFDDAFALLELNAQQFPRSSVMYVFRGNLYLMRRDTVSATTAFREAIRRDSTNVEPRQRLQAIGQRPS